MRAPLTRTRSTGFTLIEMMVGMALGLITTVIIAQVMINAEGNRHTTSSGSDAQINGALALYSLSRDLQGAGYGLISHGAALGCPIVAKYGSNASLAFTLAPATITVDSSGNPTLRTLSSGRSSFSVPMTVKTDHAQNGSVFTVNSSTGVSEGDLMMAIPLVWSNTLWCTAFQVVSSGAQALSATSIPHTSGSGAAWNPVTTASLMPTAGYIANASYIVNLGQIVYREYQLSNQNLVMRELQSNGTLGADQTLATGIVSMRVLYGKDTSSTKDGVVDAYDTTTPTTPDAWSRVLTVRIALVARSAVREKDAVTTTDPRWDVGTATTVTGTVNCPDSDTRQCLVLTMPRSSSTDTEWQHYRYKVYDTVVPLRNVLWSAV
jgi:type IV pilus assembly protein PilW